MNIYLVYFSDNFTNDTNCNENQASLVTSNSSDWSLMINVSNNHNYSITGFCNFWHPLDNNVSLFKYNFLGKLFLGHSIQELLYSFKNQIKILMERQEKTCFIDYCV